MPADLERTAERSLPEVSGTSPEPRGRVGDYAIRVIETIAERVEYGCLREHLSMSARYGLTQLPGTGPELFDSVSHLGYVVFGRTDRLPEPTRTRIDDLVRAMRSGTSTHILHTAVDKRPDRK